MALLGPSALVIWHGIQAGAESAFEHYHTVEHMPERLGIPGFLRGRRYAGEVAGAWSCFTLYESSHIEVFRSPQYLARLNAPTDWTRQVQPTMRDFLRGACGVLCSLGQGTGSVVYTARLRAESGQAWDWPRAARLAGALMGEGGVCGAHVLAHQPDIASAPTRETRLRPSTSNDAFEAVLMLEAIHADCLADAAPALGRALQEAGASVGWEGHYRLSYQLDTPRA